MGNPILVVVLLLASLCVAFGFPISCGDVEIIDSVTITEPKEKQWPRVSELNSLIPQNVFVAKTVDWSTISTEAVIKTHKQVVNVHDHGFSFEHNVVRAWVAGSEESKQDVLLVSSRYAKAARDGSLSDVFGKHVQGKKIISAEEAKNAIGKAHSDVHLHAAKKLLRFTKSPDGSCEFHLLYSVYGARADGVMVHFELSATDPKDLRMRKLPNKKHASLLRSSSKVSTSLQASAKMSNVVLNWDRHPNGFTLTTDGAAITDHTTIAGWHLLHYTHAGAVQVQTKSQDEDIKIQDNQNPMTAGHCLTGGVAYNKDCPSPAAAIITHYNAVHAYHFFRGEYGWVSGNHFPATPSMVVDIDDDVSPSDSAMTHNDGQNGHGASIQFGSGEQDVTYGRGVDAGLVGHEFAHAVWLTEHGFGAGQGTDGVEEAFCDVMGLRVKAAANGAGDTWGIHADLYLPAPDDFDAADCPAGEDPNGDNTEAGCINRDRDFSLACHGDGDVLVYPRPYQYYVCPGGVTMYAALAEHANNDPHIQGLIIGRWYYRMRHAGALPDDIANRMLIPFSLTTGAIPAVSAYLEFAQWTLYWLQVRATYYNNAAFCATARAEWVTLGFPDGDLPACP